MNRRARVGSIICAVLVLGGAGELRAQNAIVQFDTTNFQTLPTGGGGCDDCSTNAVPLNIGGTSGINFFGNSFTNIYVNNNGNVTFGSSLAGFTPNAFVDGVQCDDGNNCPIIAPFFADVDTTGPGSRLVQYGNATVQDSYGNPNGTSFNAFVANYINVGYFSEHADKLNSFQVILIDRSDQGAGDFDIEFNYNSIQWETGDADGGMDGLGGTSAAVGYSNGLTGKNNIYLQLPGSLVNGALIDGGPDALISHSLNSTEPGRYIFPVRQGQVILFPESLSCVPAILGQSGASTCTVGLTGNAPAGGVTNVTLSSSSPALTVPASVTIPAGQSSATFTATASNVSSNQQATVTATFGGSSLTTTVTVTNAVQTGYIGVFYDSTPPSPCPANLTTLCTVNSNENNDPNVGDGAPIDGPVFVFVNTSSTPITNALFSVSDAASSVQDSFTIGTLGPNQTFILVPGVTDDGQNHGSNNFFTVTGTPNDTSDNGPSDNAARFTFTGQQGGTQIQSVDVCGIVGAPVFTPACTQGASNDGAVPNINFLGGPGDNDGPCNNCFGPQIVALLNTVTSGGSSGPVTITTTTLTNENVSTSGTQTLTASGGTAPYTWTLDGGTLPPGTTLSSSGTLSGTPTKAGTYTFSVKVTDSTGAFAVETLSVTISPQTVTITTPSPLPAGMVTVEYPEQVLSATGGFAPYTFTLAANSELPAGLTLDAGGSISGTPTSAGSSNVTITATDITGQAGSATLSITVRPLGADLTLSSGSLGFTLAAGAVTLPDSEDVDVEATDPTKILNFSAKITTSASWLTLVPASVSATTPDSFEVALTAAASQLAASTTPYTATITVTCTSSPCTGNAQTVKVSLLVSTVSPELTALTDLLSFSTPAANAQSTSQALQVQNSGGGTVTITSVTCGSSWCVPGGAPPALGGGATASINVTANPAGLSAGFYFTELTIVSSAGSVTVPVALEIQSNPSLQLSPSGVQLSAPAGGTPANPDTTFLVNIEDAPSANSAVAWSAAVLPGAPWLQLGNTSASSTGSTPGTVGYSVSAAAVNGLAPGAYYGTIRVTSSGVINSPQDFEVVLNVLAANVPQVPNPTPAGLTLIATANGNSVSQPDLLYASATGAVPYQASATTSDGNAWLSVTPATGTTTASTPAQTTITANPAGLAAGVYHGTVSYSLAAAAVPAVNVTLIVRPGGSSQQPDANPRGVAGCTPAKVVPTSTSLVSNFATAAAWPTPLQVQLNDDCGNPLPGGQVVATFSNGDPPLILAPQDATSGLFNGTWTPHGSGAQVTVKASGSAPSLISAAIQISGAVDPNAVPTINPGGTVHAFTPQSGAPLAPGTWMAIYGSFLAPQTVINNNAVFPTSLSGTSVIIGGTEAPLYFVSAGQINALIPFELSAGQTYQVIVNNNGALSAPAPLQTGPLTPGVYAYPSGFAGAEDAVTGALICEEPYAVNCVAGITGASPAKPGEYIAIYLVGMGSTTTPITSGQPSPPNELTTVQPTVTLNGENISPILYSGLTPTAVGLYQINFQVPADAPNGDLTLIVTQGSAQTPPVILPVHN